MQRKHMSTSNIFTTHIFLSYSSIKENINDHKYYKVKTFFRDLLAFLKLCQILWLYCPTVLWKNDKPANTFYNIMKGFSLGTGI